MPQHERELEQPCDARNRFVVADVRFDGADGQRCSGVAARPENGAKRLQLNWIAQGGTRAMRLNVANLGGLYARVGERGAQYSLL